MTNLGPESMRVGRRILMVFERSERSRYFESALPLLRSAGFTVIPVTVAPEGPLHTALEELGFSPKALGVASARRYPLGAMRLARLMRRESPDLIHAHEAIPSALAGAAKRIARTPAALLFHRHHVAVDGAQRRFSQLASRWSDRTIAVSAAAAAGATGIDGVSEARVCVALNGVPDHPPIADRDLREVEAELGIAPQALVLLVVARLRTAKGVPTMLAALERAKVEDGKVVAVIAGDGPERPAIESEIRRRNLQQRVVCAGYQEDVAPLFARAQVVLVPSHDEPFGLVAVEAAAAQTPVVASAVGGLVEIVRDGYTGLLVPPRDPASLAQAIEDLVSDADRRAELGENARRRYEEIFTDRAMVHRWIQCYDRAGRPIS
jgi:glycosyltransferase involved in cell wall biosynthesis